MIIDLTKLDSYVINLDHQPERLAEVSIVLNSKNINFTRHRAFNAGKGTGTNTQQGFQACSQSHLSLLSSLKSPFIVFEDDIVITDNWKSVLDIPEDTDALHLGASIFGYVRPNINHSYPGVVSVTKYNDDFKRTYNMCSTHGIVYLTEKFRLSVIESIKDCFDKCIPWDMGLAKIQKDFVYLTPNKPFIYQKDLPQYTNVELKV